MRRVVEYINCDICRADKANKVRTSVVFRTEQTEGRPCSPYSEIKELDLCDDCIKRLFDGEGILADGAQGYNNYYFRNKK